MGRGNDLSSSSANGNLNEGGGGDMDCDVVTVKRSPALNWFLSLLDGLESVEGKQEELRKVRLALCPSDKPLFHLILLGFLDDEGVQKVFNDEEKSGAFADVLDLIEEENARLSFDVYLDLVIHLGLIEECIAMIMANSEATAALVTARILVNRLIHCVDVDVGDGMVIEETLYCLARLVRSSQMGVKAEYFDCFGSLCSYVLGEKFSILNDAEKLILVFKILGCALICYDDYVKDSETAGLLQEWQLDQTTSLSLRSIKLYETLFKMKPKDYKRSSIAEDVLLKLDEILTLTSCPFSKNFALDGYQVRGNLHMIISNSNYVGGCAYLVNLIAKRRNVNFESYFTLSNLIVRWIDQKPKMKEADFDELELQNFDYFCETMNNFENHKSIVNYRQDWVEKFLKFPANDVIGTRKGSQIAEKFITGANHQVLLEYFGKVAQFEGELNRSQKIVVLNLLMQSEASEQELHERIKAVFRNGTHNKLRLEDFNVSINKLCSQLSTIQFEKDLVKLEKFKQETISLCVQDPLEAVFKLLDQSIRTEHYRALLGFAGVFFELTALHQDDGDEPQLPDTLLLNSFNKLLKYLPMYPDSAYECVIKFLTDKKLLTVEATFNVLKVRILKLLQANKITLNRVTGLVVLLKSCINSRFTEGDFETSQTILFNEICSFVVRLYRFLSLYTNKSTFSQAMVMRGQLNEILNCLKTSQLADSVFNKLSPDMSIDLDEITIFDIGILYIRCSILRATIMETLESDDVFQDLNLEQCVRNTVLWVSNSSEPEWPSVTQFLSNVVLKSKPSDQKKWFTFTVLNKSLLAAYSVSVEMKVPDVYLHMLKFYEFALHEEGDDFESKEIIETIMAVALSMSNKKCPKGRKSFGITSTTMFPTLSYMLDKLEFMKNNQELDGSSRQELLNKLNSFPPLDDKCQPIRLLIQKQLS